MIAAVAAGTVAQGGFYLYGRLLVASLAGLALAAAFRAGGSRSVSADRHSTWLIMACAGLAGWAIVRGALDGKPWAGLPLAATLAGVLAAVFVLRRADGRQRELCALTLVAIGVLVAVSGWLGVVWHVQPWALATDQLLWRASSTLTYANAAAAILAPTAVLAIALLLARPLSYLRQVAAFLLLAGLGATFSRGGLLAFLVGLAVLAALAGVRLTAEHAAAPVLGAVVTVAALTPSVPVAARPQSILAVAGLAVGFAITLGIARLASLWRWSAVLAGLAVAATGFAVLAGSGRGFRVFAESRMGLSSPTRIDSARAALGLVADNPIAGVGPGRSTFPWMIDGHLVTGRYAHNEYLQILVELGTIGLVLVILVLAVLGHAIIRGRTGTRHRLLWSGSAAAFAAVAIHSGFDFLWQLPVIPLIGAILAGLAWPAEAKVLEEL